MNIFVLDNDPVIAAQTQCDKHVVKMIVESAQMLSTAHRLLDGNVSIVQRVSPKTGKRVVNPRRFYGCELKPEYYAAAEVNLTRAVHAANAEMERTLF